MRKCIYSVITDNYDTLHPAPKFPGWDSIMHIDETPEDSKGWEIREIKETMGFSSLCPILRSREIKILSHIILPEYDLVCYIDSNQKMFKAPPDVPMRFSHPRRYTIFEEAEQIIKNGRFSAEAINEQIDHYKRQGYKDQGLFLNGFSIRDNNDERMNHLHDVWYEETSRFTPRDQLSLPYAIWKTGVKLTNIQPPNVKETFAVVHYAHDDKMTRI